MDEKQDEFSFDNNRAKKIVRKAKLWSTLKTFVIVVLVTPIVVLAIWIGVRQLSNHQANTTMQELEWINEISAPNVHISNQTYVTDWLGGEVTTQTYKVIGKRPYIWEPIPTKYDYWGSSTRRYGSYGSIQMNSTSTNPPLRYNSSTGDREMAFYFYEIPYTAYPDSISQLQKLDGTTLVELGLSFDKAYSMEDITGMFPAEVQPVWWWVDAYNDSYIHYLKQGKQSIAADSPNIYGFHAEQFKPYGGIDTFINSIDRLRESHKQSFKYKADEAHQALAGDNNTIDKSDIKIIGAVVTGRAKQLEALKGQPFIKASTFGVISAKPDIEE